MCRVLASSTQPSPRLLLGDRRLFHRWAGSARQDSYRSAAPRRGHQLILRMSLSPGGWPSCLSCALFRRTGHESAAGGQCRGNTGPCPRAVPARSSVAGLWPKRPRGAAEHGLCSQGPRSNPWLSHSLAQGPKTRDSAWQCRRVLRNGVGALSGDRRELHQADAGQEPTGCWGGGAHTGDYCPIARGLQALSPASQRQRLSHPGQQISS